MRLRVREWKRKVSVRWCVEFEIGSSTRMMQGLRVCKTTLMP